MIQNLSFRGLDEGVEVTVDRGIYAGRSAIFPGITEDKMNEGYARYRGGDLIQRAFPFLNADQREFLMTGILPEEWDAMWAEEEEI
jgi:hypothetical protein